LGKGYEIPPGRQVEVMATFVERGLLNQS
jgi:hypothetical protein